MARSELHSFWCPICGRKAMDLQRQQGHQHKDFHRKKLYCPWCKTEHNCIETKNIEQEYEFKINFERGVYNGESSNTVDHGGITGQW